MEMKTAPYLMAELCLRRNRAVPVTMKVRVFLFSKMADFKNTIQEKAIYIYFDLLFGGLFLISAHLNTMYIGNTDAFKLKLRTEALQKTERPPHHPYPHISAIQLNQDSRSPPIRRDLKDSECAEFGGKLFMPYVNRCILREELCL